MTPLTWIAIAAVGGAGAVARFVIESLAAARSLELLPVGTFVVNISGAFVLGLLDGFALSGNALLIAGTATLGAYTTFSGWMLQTQRLAESRQHLYALLNVVLSVIVGFGAIALGHYIGKQL